MKHLFLSVAAAALATGAVSTAHAEPFNGAYVGAQGGWSETDIGNASTPVGTVEVDRSKDVASGGVYMGYDFKLSPSFVVGAEAGVQVGVDDEVTRITDDARVTMDPKHAIDLTARAGFLVDDDTLVYARGGYANARVKTSVVDSVGVRSGTDNRDGWLVGGGIEHALSDDFSARAEYRYSDLGDRGGKLDRHQALFGISYRF